VVSPEVPKRTFLPSKRPHPTYFLAQSILGKRLAIFEAAMGGIYLAVIIALIVGRYMSIQVEQGSESKINLKK